MDLYSSPNPDYTGSANNVAILGWVEVLRERIARASAQGLIFLGFGEEPEADNRFSQNIKVAPDEVGVELLLCIEEKGYLLLVKVDIDLD